MTITEYKDAMEKQLSDLEFRIKTYELAIRELNRQLEERSSIENIAWIISPRCDAPKIKVLDGPFNKIIWKDTLKVDA